MYINTLLLSIASFVAIMGSWIMYLWSIPQMKVQIRPTGTIFVQCLGIVLAIAAITPNLAGSESFSLVVFLPAAFSLIMGVFFLLLYSQRKTPIGDLKVNVGDKLLPFTAATSNGKTFNSDEFAGKRILLKFFRGAW